MYKVLYICTYGYLLIINLQCTKNIQKATKDFNIDNNLVDLGVTFGYFKDEDGKVKISNRLLEQRLYNYFVTNLKLRNVAGYNIKANFIEGTGLNIEKILIKFQEFMKEQYSIIGNGIGNFKKNYV